MRFFRGKMIILPRLHFCATGRGRNERRLRDETSFSRRFGSFLRGVLDSRSVWIVGVSEIESFESIVRYFRRSYAGYWCYLKTGERKRLRSAANFFSFYRCGVVWGTREKIVRIFLNSFHGWLQRCEQNFVRNFYTFSGARSNFFF